jgi:putative ABC transport system permease protein
MIGNVETALLFISIMVVFTAILGMIITILAALNERRREMAILRSIGAKPIQIFLLFSTEATIMALLGVLIGFCSLYGILFFIQPSIENLTGLYMEITAPKWNEIILMTSIIGVSIFASILPAFRAYRTSLSDGLMIRG